MRKCTLAVGQLSLVYETKSRFEYLSTDKEFATSISVFLLQQDIVQIYVGGNNWWRTIFF